MQLVPVAAYVHDERSPLGGICFEVSARDALQGGGAPQQPACLASSANCAALPQPTWLLLLLVMLRLFEPHGCLMHGIACWGRLG